MAKKIQIPLKLPKVPPRPLLPPAMALKKVTSKSGLGVYASADTLFKGAVFGRDSIEVAEDLLNIRPRLVKRIIMTLASLQGEVVNHLNEEEPGKIIHEYRRTKVDGRTIKGVSRHIYDELSGRWGGTDTEMAYYGSVDSTPHFVRLVGAYVRANGSKILNQPVYLRSGYKVTLLIVLENAVSWLEDKISSSKSGLIEYHRLNIHGIENQVWKDSKEFYVHSDGQSANHSKPIASIEVQGLAYDAFMTASRILPSKDKYIEIAKNLQRKTCRLFWIEKENYFALGLDYGKEDNIRIIRTKTANPAALLDSEFFESLAKDDKKKFITSIVKTIMSPDFLTDAGIRSRALSNAGLVEYWDYHGSYVTWPKETYDIAKGLRRQGFPHLAKQLENRLLNLTLRSRKYLEFAYVDNWGRVLAGSPSASEHGDLIIVDSTNKPEQIQAWTVSAIMAIIAKRLALKVRVDSVPRSDQWKVNLEKDIIKHIPQVSRLTTPWSLAIKYPAYKYRVIKDKSSNSTDMPAR